MRTLAKILTASLMIAGQALAIEPRAVHIEFNLQRQRTERVNHKAYSGLSITGVVKNAGQTIDLTGAYGDIGFKWGFTDTNFFAYTAITITDGPAGEFSADFTSAEWATNIASKTRIYGDVRIPALGNPLPSIEMDLYPSANWGARSYVQPSFVYWKTNGTALIDIQTVDWNGFTVSQSNSTLIITDVQPTVEAGITTVDGSGTTSVSYASGPYATVPVPVMTLGSDWPYMAVPRVTAATASGFSFIVDNMTTSFETSPYTVNWHAIQ